jgi:hypothetical protein
MIVNITTLLPKDVFTNYGYYDETVISEDYELWLRLCLLFDFRMHLLEQKLVKYRRHESNTSLQALKKFPDHVDHTRKMVLLKLDSSIRSKYENALREFKKQNKEPIFWKIKGKVKKILYRFLPNSTAKKIHEKYRKIKYHNRNKN